MGKPIGYFFMVCAALALIFLVADLVWMRRTGLMFMPFGDVLTAWVIGAYVASFVSSMFCAWIAFVLDEVRSTQREIFDRIAGRGSGPLTVRSEPRVRRNKAA